MIKVAGAVLAGMLALGSCEGPSPAPAWSPGAAQPPGTVRSKEIVLADPNDPSKGIRCYRIVLELQGDTSEHCVGKEEWVRAAPGHLMVWD